MTTPRVLIDTGPLVALYSRRDKYHHICVEQLHQLSAPLFTCWPVITEAAWLLKEHPPAVHSLLKGFEAGLLRLLLMEENATPWLANFMNQYHTLGAQLADACLVYLAEQEKIETIFTLDRRGFLVYRLSGDRTFQLLPAL